LEEALLALVRSVLQLLVTAEVDLSSLILFTLMKESVRSSEMSVLTSAQARCEEALFLHSVLQFLLTANVVPSSLILVILMMEAILSSETSVLTRAHGVTSKKTTFSEPSYSL
jgi:hypothetical protein